MLNVYLYLFILYKLIINFFIFQGEYKIKVDLVVCGEWCGLILVGGLCYCVIIQGLKWNLGKYDLVIFFFGVGNFYRMIQN